jgi:hypothetical protein
MLHSFSKYFFVRTEVFIKFQKEREASLHFQWKIRMDVLKRHAAACSLLIATGAEMKLKGCEEKGVILVWGAVISRSYGPFFHR